MKNYSKEITELQELIKGVSTERWNLEDNSNNLITDILNEYFNPFKEFEIKVYRNSATFHMKDQENYNKEIFSLYFDERYKEETKLRLSYYTTSSNSDFELERLMHLGKVAKIIKDRSEGILKDIFEARKSNLERSNELYRISSGYEKQISEYRKAELADKKVQIELDLRGNKGITFDIPQYIYLKRTYSPKIDKIRVTEVKGKTCTVAIEMGGGSYKTTESRVNLENLIDQISIYNIL
jgi:hypothetical protein